MKNGKRIIALSLAMAMMLMAFTSSLIFADATLEMNNVLGNLEVISVEEDGDTQKVTVSEDGAVTDIFVDEDVSTVTTTMVNQETKETEYFLIDKEDETMYSSITGETIDIADELENTAGSFERATPAETKKLPLISYYTIYTTLKGDASFTGIAGLILGIVAAAVTIPMLTTVAILLNTFSFALTIIADNMKSKSKTRGYVAIVERITYTKHQAGQVFHTYKYKITSIKADKF